MEVLSHPGHGNPLIGNWTFQFLEFQESETKLNKTIKLWFDWFVQRLNTLNALTGNQPAQPSPETSLQLIPDREGCLVLP